MKTYCLTLDLYDDPRLIEEYKWYHEDQNVWPEVTESIRSQRILSQEIYPGYALGHGPANCR